MSRPRIGVLLAQIGTPAAPTARALRPYLRQFLGDPRVIEVNRIAWWFILNLLILPRRPAVSAALYRRVWTEKGSPLLLHTLEQAQGLERALAGAGAGEGVGANAAAGTVAVEPGMRYGEPSIPSALGRLRERGAGRLLVFPMFPQYAGATTGSIHDAVFEHFRRERVVPPLRFVPPYPAHPAYIRALAQVSREALARLPWQPDRFLLSFHGVPRRYVEAGDVYESQVEETARALAGALGLEAGGYELCYQSRFGREEWLKPYAFERLEELARDGAKRIAAFCPGFTADCLETIDEIGREGRRRFVEAGGEDLRLLPCLNAHAAWIEAMAEIAREELSGWL